MGAAEAGSKVNSSLLNVIVRVPSMRASGKSVSLREAMACLTSSGDRMVSVFDAFSRELALPPIEVVDASRKGYRYWLYHGRHRLAASIAVGFSVVPAVIVRSLDEIKRSEGMA
jgi:uncharacterized ParB-like nuclease family protein